MAVTDVHRGIGDWSVQLREDTPPGVIGGLDWFGHVVFVPGRMDPAERGDELLDAARYVGILRSVSTAGQPTIGGVGLAAWLGDEDGKGNVLEYPGVTLTGATFADAVRALLPPAPNDAVKEGTLYAGVSGTYTGVHMYQSSRTAIDYVCTTMGGEWRVTNRARLDAGPAASLFRMTPTCVIVRRGAGYDVTLKALPGSISTTRDAKEYSSRVVLIAAALAGGTADAVTVPYKDLHGNTVKITRVVDEQDETLIANAPARASAALAEVDGIRDVVRLNVDDFDIAGDFAPGDMVWVYDPDGGVYDTGQQVDFRGTVLQPKALRVKSVTWPVEDGYTVAYRSGTGVWTDLTPWVQWEDSGGGEVEVADLLSSALTPGIGSIGTQVVGGGGGLGDPAVPGAPVFGEFVTTSYQPADGAALATVKVTWAQPLNTDGSTIVDGDHYEIRYRPVSTSENPLVPAGPTVPLGPGPFVATRSRLPFSLGVFDNTSTTAKFDAFQTMTGGLLDFVDQHPAWADIIGNHPAKSWWWYPHLGRGYDLMVSVPLYSGSITTDNTAMWTTSATNLVAHWSRTWWRLGVEFNLANSWQANNSNYMTWCTRFNEAAAAIKAVQPGARIVLCPNEGSGAGVLSQANTLYIINNTNWDVLAPDYYDQWEPIYNSGQAALRFGTADTFGTMNYYLGIVRTKARKLGLGEWGVASGTQWAGHQGGDNPYYINYLMDWLATNAADIEMVSYFEEPDAYLKSDITTSATNPNARTAFQTKAALYRAP